MSSPPLERTPRPDPAALGWPKYVKRLVTLGAAHNFQCTGLETHRGPFLASEAAVGIQERWPGGFYPPMKRPNKMSNGVVSKFGRGYAVADLKSGARIKPDPRSPTPENKELLLVDLGPSGPFIGAGGAAAAAHAVPAVVTRGRGPDALKTRTYLYLRLSKICILGAKFWCEDDVVFADVMEGVKEAFEIVLKMLDDDQY